MACRVLSSAIVFAICQLGGAANAQPFSVTVPGISIADNNILVLPIFLPAGLENVEVLELELDGFSHANPQDIDMYLVNPFGAVALILSDCGGGIAVSGLTLTFADDATEVPEIAGPLVSGRYQPEGLFEGSDGGLASLGYSGVAIDAWVLVIVDDTAGGVGNFDSVTLRGVSEPHAVVPAVSEWGLVILTLVGLAAGSILFRPSDA